MQSAFRAELASVGHLDRSKSRSTQIHCFGDGGFLNQAHYHRPLFERYFKGEMAMAGNGQVASHRRTMGSLAD